jgi:hypothetical protein
VYPAPNARNKHRRRSTLDLEPIHPHREASTVVRWALDQVWSDGGGIFRRKMLVAGVRTYVTKLQNSTGRSEGRLQKPVCGQERLPVFRRSIRTPRWCSSFRMGEDPKRREAHQGESEEEARRPEDPGRSHVERRTETSAYDQGDSQTDHSASSPADAAAVHR